MVIQEYVQGEDDQHFSSNIFVDESGLIKGFYIAQKMRVYPVSAGTGTYIKTINNKEVEELSFDIVSKLRLKGLINIQFKKDSYTGKYMLMEIHIRNSLWSLLGSKAGANLGEHYYMYLTSDNNSHQEILTARSDVKYINLAHDFLAAIEYQKENKLTIYQWLKSLQGERVFALLSISDPLPIVYKVGTSVKNRFKLMGRNIFRSNNKPTIYSSNTTTPPSFTNGSTSDRLSKKSIEQSDKNDNSKNSLTISMTEKTK